MTAAERQRCACGRRIIAMESRRSGVCGPCLAERRGKAPPQIWRSRAERAEARVKELEAAVAYWKANAPDLAELRGEDRG